MPSYRYISHLTFGNTLALPAFPPLYPSQVHIDDGGLSDTTGKVWRMWANEHAVSYIAGGKMHLNDYQADGPFSNSCLQCQAAGSDFATSGDFMVELTHDALGYVLGYTAFLACATTYSNGPDGTGEWALTRGAGGLQFTVQTAPGVTAGVSTAGSYSGPGTGQYIVAVERVAGVMRLYLNGVLAGTQTANLGSHPIAAIAPTLGACQNGAYYLPNNYGTGDYYDFKFGVPAVPIEYPAGLPAPKEAPITAAERRSLSPAGGPFGARAVEHDWRAAQDLVWPLMRPDEAAAFVAWGDAQLERWGAWFAAPSPSWPLPQGMAVGVRRFLHPPARSFVAGGYWRFSASMEVRGRGMLPQGVL